MATATRLASNNEGDGNSSESSGQVTATRAMAAATTVVGKDVGDCNVDEGGRRQKG